MSRPDPRPAPRSGVARCAIVLLALALSSAASVRAGDVPPEAAAAYDRGYERSKRGDLDGAIAEYSRAIALAPRFEDAFNNRGVVWATKGQLDAASADLTRAIELAPGFVGAYSNRGDVRRRQGDLVGAAIDFSRAIEGAQGFARPRSQRGQLQWRARDFAGAILDLRRALEIDPARDADRFFLYFAEAIVSGEPSARAAYDLGVARRTAPPARDSWSSQVDLLIRGERTVADVERELEASSAPRRELDRCRVRFCAGMLARVRGDVAGAKALLDACVATGRHEESEHLAAIAVLGWPRSPESGK